MPTIPKQESQNVEFKESWNDGFRNAGLADPVIEEDEGGIRITLFRPAWVARELGAALVAKKPESGPESGARVRGRVGGRVRGRVGHFEKTDTLVPVFIGLCIRI